MAAERRVLEIPGMYFDAEKNKYFKIEAGTAHSSDIVKRRRLNDSKADEERTRRLTRKAYIRRSRTLQDPLLGGLLHRETGGRPAREDAVGAGFDGPELIFKDNNDPKSPIPSFAWDPVTRGLFIPRNGHRMLVGCPESASRLPFGVGVEWPTSCRRPIYQHMNCMSLVYEPKRISSININDAARLVAVTWIDINHFGIVIGKLAKELAIANDREHMVSDGSHVHIRHIRPQGSNSNLTIWTSTPAPPSSSLSFVVGMDDHVMTIEKEQSNTSWHVNSGPKTREILALEFVHNQPNVVLAGDRLGDVSLLDLRLAYPKFGHDTIRNQQTVSHIKSLDHNRVLVAGPGVENTMFQYDLRWRKDTPAKGSRKKSESYTKPILEYPDHYNTFPRFGLDVDVEAGLVAAAQEDQTVQLFSLHGAHRIDFVGKSMRREHPVESLRFVPDREGGANSLYVAGSNSIDRYAW